MTHREMTSTFTVAKQKRLKRSTGGRRTKRMKYTKVALKSRNKLKMKRNSQQPIRTSLQLKTKRLPKILRAIINLPLARSS